MPFNTQALRELSGNYKLDPDNCNPTLARAHAPESNIYARNVGWVTIRTAANGTDLYIPFQVLFFVKSKDEGSDLLKELNGLDTEQVLLVRHTPAAGLRTSLFQLLSSITENTGQPATLDLQSYRYQATRGT